MVPIFGLPDPYNSRLAVLDRQLNIIEEHTFPGLLINTHMTCTHNNTHLFLGTGGV
ncbi:MAG: hypothetical protein ACFFBD_18440 [Candidatus Hodarchaeota archaeon]